MQIFLPSMQIFLPSMQSIKQIQMYGQRSTIKAWPISFLLSVFVKILNQYWSGSNKLSVQQKIWITWGKKLPDWSPVSFLHVSMRNSEDPDQSARWSWVILDQYCLSQQINAIKMTRDSPWALLSYDVLLISSTGKGAEVCKHLFYNNVKNWRQIHTYMFGEGV